MSPSFPARPSGLPATAASPTPCRTRISCVASSAWPSSSRRCATSDGEDPCNRDAFSPRARPDGVGGPPGRRATGAHPGRARRRGAGRGRSRHPLGDAGDSRGARRRARPDCRRAGGCGARQRRHPRRDTPGRDGRERAGVEHPLGRRARFRPVVGAGPQHSPGARRPRRGTLGALQVGGRRAARQDARDPRPGPRGLPGGPACRRLRDAADRL